MAKRRTAMIQEAKYQDSEDGQNNDKQGEQECRGFQRRAAPPMTRNGFEVVNIRGT